MGFSRQEYWSGLLSHSPGDLLNPSVLHWQAGSLPLEPPGKPGWEQEAAKEKKNLTIYFLSSLGYCSLLWILLSTGVYITKNIYFLKHNEPLVFPWWLSTYMSTIWIDLHDWATNTLSQWTERTRETESMVDCVEFESECQIQFQNWHMLLSRASLVAQTVKHLPSMRESRVQPLGREDPLEKEMAIHSSTLFLAWKIPWMEEPDRLQSMGSQRVWQDWATSLSLHFQAMWLSANHTYISELFFSCQRDIIMSQKQSYLFISHLSLFQTSSIYEHFRRSYSRD